MHKILALDLGTLTGLSYNPDGTDSVQVNTHTLATKEEIAAWGRNRMRRRCDPRILRFADVLNGLSPKPDIVVFEDVEFSTYTLQTQLWSSLRTTVWLTFGRSTILECVPVTTLKKFATGSGAADKAAMLAALKRKFPQIKVVGLDDNAIDSLWLWIWATENLGRLTLQ